MWKLYCCFCGAELSERYKDLATGKRTFDCVGLERHVIIGYEYSKEQEFKGRRLHYRYLVNNLRAYRKDWRNRDTVLDPQWIKDDMLLYKRFVWNFFRQERRRVSRDYPGMTILQIAQRHLSAVGWDIRCRRPRVLARHRKKRLRRKKVRVRG